MFYFLSCGQHGEYSMDGLVCQWSTENFWYTIRSSICTCLLLHPPPPFPLFWFSSHTHSTPLGQSCDGLPRGLGIRWRTRPPPNTCVSVLCVEMKPYTCGLIGGMHWKSRIFGSFGDSIYNIYTCILLARVDFMASRKSLVRCRFKKTM